MPHAKYKYKRQEGTLQEDTGSEQELKRTQRLFAPSKYVNCVQFVRSKHAVWKMMKLQSV